MDSGRITASVVGVAVVLLLGFLRTRFTWWPLHPIGYAVGSTDTMTWIWFPVLLGWLFKTLILRYGGVKVYRQALPFFIGLVLGRLRDFLPVGAVLPGDRPRRAIGRSRFE